MGPFLRSCPCPGCVRAGDQPYSVSCEGRGRVCSSCWWGSVSMGQLSLWVGLQSTAALPVFVSPCQSSLQPQRGQQRRPGERRDSPGPGRITHSRDSATRVYHTLTCQSLFFRTCPMRAGTMAKVNPFIPTQQRQAGTSGHSGQAVCSSGLRAAGALCWHGTCAHHGSAELQAHAQCRGGSRCIRHSLSYPELGNS